MKYLLVIGDGIADNPIADLGGKTPMEAAHKPFMDALAAKGRLYRVRTVPEGVAPGSDTANLSIFGSDPRLYYTGRAPLEAAGVGLELKAGNIAFRCNVMAVSQEDLPYEELSIVSHSAGNISSEDAIAVAAWLFADDEFKAAAEKAGVKICTTDSYRHLAVQESGDIEGIILIPPHDHLGEKVGANLPSGNANAEVLRSLMELAHKRLADCPVNIARIEKGLLPANSIWFWAEGTVVSLPAFGHTSKGTVISSVPLFKGIARLTGLKAVDVEGATGLIDTNYEGKVNTALKALEDGDDFAAIHIEAPDACSHDGDIEGKVKAIGLLDSRVVKPLVEGLEKMGEDFRLLVISDHKTLLSTRAHDANPVPALIYDSTAQNEGFAVYTEKEAEKGELIDPGTEIMSVLFDKR